MPSEEINIEVAQKFAPTVNKIPFESTLLLDQAPEENQHLMQNTT